MRFNGLGVKKPDVKAIIKTIIENTKGLDDVLFLGGEPCLFLDELLECVTELKNKTELKVFVTTAMPKICYDEKEKFFKLLSVLDGLNISAQHYDERIADKIRRTESKYDRQSFYRSLPFKEKIRINLNIVKPFLHTKEDLIICLSHYDKMGFNSIKLSEIQHGKDVYVSFADVFGIEMKSAYSNGCQSYLNMDEIIKGFSTPVLLKRSCFLCENSLKATIADGIKVIAKLFKKAKNKYGVVYGNGTLTKGWV
jgi:organic radical activating enzyme